MKPSVAFLKAQRDGCAAIALAASVQRRKLEEAAEAEQNEMAAQFLLDMSKQMGERHLEFAAEVVVIDRQIREREAEVQS